MRYSAKYLLSEKSFKALKEMGVENIVMSIGIPHVGECLDSVVANGTVSISGCENSEISGQSINLRIMVGEILNSEISSERDTFGCLFADVSKSDDAIFAGSIVAPPTKEVPAKGNMIPSHIKEGYSPKVKKFVLSVEEFQREIREAQNKKYEKDDLIAREKDPRKKAILEEEKEMAESISKKAFVVNEKYASLSVSDLGLTLNLNSPVDLSRISAKKLALSGDLIRLIEKGDVKFIGESDVDSYFKKAAKGSLYLDGLEVYSSVDEAENAISGEGVSRDYIEIGDIDVDDAPKTLPKKKPLEGGNIIKMGKTKTLTGSPKNSSVRAIVRK